jgi:predicted small integral membrane protein
MDNGWLGLAVIMVRELAAGGLGFLGALRMTASRAEDAQVFHAAKSLATAGGILLKAR